MCRFNHFNEIIDHADYFSMHLSSHRLLNNVVFYCSLIHSTGESFVHLLGNRKETKKLSNQTLCNAYQQRIHYPQPEKKDPIRFRGEKRHKSCLPLALQITFFETGT